MSRHLRKSKVWNNIFLLILVLMLISLTITIITGETETNRMVFGNYLIPLIVLLLVSVSTIINEYDEILSIVLILYATYVNLNSGNENTFSINMILWIVFPALFIVRTLQYLMRNQKKKDIKSYLIVIFFIVIYIYLWIKFT